MSQNLFPKPAPIAPLPEDVWLNQVDRSEVGREPFFTDRDAEYEVFRNSAQNLASGRIGGGTMIFQGAPGAGKSALMLECMEAIKCYSSPEHPWVAVSVKPHSLASPVTVMRRIVQSVNEENERLAGITPDPISSGMRHLRELGATLFKQLSERGVTVGSVSVGGKPAPANKPQVSMPAEQVFLDAAPLLEKISTVVFVDEAQNTPISQSVKDVVDCIHNPPGNIPLVAAFFGLSDTKQVLRDCGLSRIARRRVCNLEPLSIEDAAISLRLMLNAYYSGTDAEKDKWASTLAELSQGWPQHINCVGVEAGRILRSNEGRVKRHLLNQALEQGANGKNEYYEGRVEAGSCRAWVYKHLAVAASKEGRAVLDALSHDEIDMLTASARQKIGQTTEEFVSDALHAGLLAPTPGVPDHYKIPIPSLGDYLRSLPVGPPQAD